MPIFQVRIRDDKGVVINQTIEAPGRQDIAELLGVMPASVLFADEHLGRQITLRAVKERRLTDPELRLFCQELAVLLDAGIPLLEAIEALADKQAGGDETSVVKIIAHQLKDGQPLSVALQQAQFDGMTIAIVAASERTGQLASSLRQHANYLSWLQRLQSRIAKAAVYPLLLLGVGTAVVLFLLIFVLPRFTGVLEGLGHDLPWASQVLIHVARFSQQHPWGLIGMVAFPVLAFSMGWQSRHIRAKITDWSWSLPGIGRRLRVVSLARLYRALGLLLAAGSPVVPSLRTVRDALPAHLHPAIDRSIGHVNHGSRLSDSLLNEGLATTISDRMIRVGERTGQVAQMCERAAVFHDEEIMRFSDVIADMINPALMLLVGFFVGGIIVLMYMPIFQLVEQIR
jgi:general secretion pathway protein F